MAILFSRMGRREKQETRQEWEFNVVDVLKTNCVFCIQGDMLKIGDKLDIEVHI